MQENRWHDQYIAAERVIDQLEMAIAEQASRIEMLEDALRKSGEINNKRDRYSDEIDGIIVAALGGANV